MALRPRLRTSFTVIVRIYEPIMKASHDSYAIQTNILRKTKKKEKKQKKNKRNKKKIISQNK